VYVYSDSHNGMHYLQIITIRFIVVISHLHFHFCKCGKRRIRSV